MNKENSASINLKKSIESSIQKETFKSVVIDGKLWMSENLNVSLYRNGDPIIEAITDDEWSFCSRNKIHAYCYYENNLENAKIFGKLYNYYSILDIRNLIPRGLQIVDQLPLIESLDTVFSNTFSHNVNKNEMAMRENVETEFNIKPSGLRRHNGNFVGKGKLFRCWSKPKNDSPFYHVVKFPGAGIDLENYFSDNNINPGNGYSIRCIKWER